MTAIVTRLALLTAIYLLALPSRDWRDAVTGVALASVVLLGTRAFRRSDRLTEATATPARLVAFVPFVLAVLVEIVKGSLQVAGYVTGLKPLGRPGIVRVPYGERSRQGVVVSGIAMSVAPGSVLVDLDDERREMIVHAVDASDPDAVIAGIQEFYERRQRHVFP